MGDYRYGGFSNQELANYLGISVPELQMIQEVMQGGATSPGSMEQAMKFAGETGGGPMGGQNRLDNIMRGIENIQQHPLGSHYKGFNPTNLLANFATGGLYGLGTNLAKGDIINAANSPGIGGSIQGLGNEIQPGLGNSLALKANISGVGAGLGAMAFGGGEAAAGGATGAGPSAASGSNIPYLVDPSGATSQMVIEGAGGALPGATLTPGALETSLASGALSGSVGGAGGSNLGAAGLGAFAAQQLAGMFAPQGGDGGAPTQGAMGAPGTPQQPRSGGSPSGSEMDTPGAGFIDPAYIKRQKGGKNSRGISDQGDLSQQQQDAQMAALYGFTGGMA